MSTILGPLPCQACRQPVAIVRRTVEVPCSYCVDHHLVDHEPDHTHATDDDPPFLIVHGTKDNLVPLSQSETLARVLADAKPAVPPILIRMNGAGHGFGSPVLNARIAQFFERHLYGAPEEISGEPIDP